MKNATADFVSAITRPNSEEQIAHDVELGVARAGKKTSHRDEIKAGNISRVK